MRLPSSASSSSSSSFSSLSPTQRRAKLPQPDVQTAKPGRRRMDKVSQFKSGYPLQRGSACLSCRKRKMKCDAGKPACGQCLKANRASDCDYDDGKSKSRTQLLQEKVSMLEGRLRDLESSPGTSNASAPSSQRFQSGANADGSPHFYNGVGDELFSGSSAGSPWLGDRYDLQLSGNGHELSRIGTPEDLQWDADPLTLTPNDLHKLPSHWWKSETLPPRIQRFLICIFLPHRHQCGFEVDVSRFQASLTSPEPPHPALLNAIYALACHFSLSPTLTPHEPRFVSRALCAISQALEASDRLVHVLQASCLLAMLFFAKGRLLEGYYHAGAAARLAVGLGLHQISIPDWLTSAEGAPGAPHTSGGAAGSLSSASSPSCVGGGAGSSILPPPADATELGERILAFWQVYNLDRCWAVATGLPVALSDDKFPRTKIKTAWPRSLEEYEVGHFMDTDYGTMHYLHSRVTSLPFSSRDSTHTLRAKATTLFERAARLSTSFDSAAQTAEQFWADFQSVDAAISRLSVCLPPMRIPRSEGQAQGHPSPGSGPEHSHPSHPPSPTGQNDMSIFVVHALLHAAAIQLHSPFAFKDPASQQKSMAIAAVATSMIHDLYDEDYAFLDPIMGTCWTSVAEALVRELIMLRAASAMEQQVTALNRQLDVVVFAMNRLGGSVPLAAYQATKVEQSRVVSY